MRYTPLALVSVGSLLAFSLSPLPLAMAAPALPAADQRAAKVRTLNTLRSFPRIASKAEWQTRAQHIREHILVSCGLWPLPEKTPLKARIFGRIARDGYRVEKVALQTYPGFYLAGNLYRPLGRGPGPFPGILNPHGHWGKGRLEDGPRGSIAARCISFARQGMVAFSYDMVGYNDTTQVNHKFAGAPANQLWQISLMGLQTWNSIRALDFLSALPEVDAKRLACTGASGGGTQTFMLGAIDDRLAAQAPNVMVSHSMQGGCLCENAPGLRVEYSNMEIAAVPAPRPQILVASTRDWTKEMLTVEGPAIQKIYRLFGAADHLRFVQFDFEHNYNQTSREAVYAWFGQWLLGHPQSDSLKEAPYQKEPDAALRVWPDGQLPADALSEAALIQQLKELCRQQLRDLQPRDAGSGNRFRQIMRPLWQHSLQLEFPVPQVLAEQIRESRTPQCQVQHLALGRPGKGDRLPVVKLTPANAPNSWAVVLAAPEGRAAYFDDTAGAKGFAAELLKKKFTVILADLFLTGALANPDLQKQRQYFTKYFCTYNRTDLQERVQDLITLCAWARQSGPVALCGTGRAGLWTLLAAPAADALVADAAGLDLTDDAALLAPDLFSPGLRRMGGFAGGASLAAPHPLLLHSAGAGLNQKLLRASYRAANAATRLRIETQPAPQSEILQWLQRTRR